jgi:hypothetical protein
MKVIKYGKLLPKRLQSDMFGYTVVLKIYEPVYVV